ncbi:MAG: T9SS type A sorting domain-containing protein [Bacteroidota bacterium]|nr:T9SS type A sorting domain-containing protein [Bacteroidota bacterium]
MKTIICFVLLSLILCTAQAQPIKRSAPWLKQHNAVQSPKSVNINYIRFSNSISGPFTSPAAISVHDTFFIKMDVTPLGNVDVEYFLDLNENGVIDSLEYSIHFMSYTDNSVAPPIDLDITQGVIISYEKPDQVPSMQLIAEASDDTMTSYGILIFQNPSASFTLSGFVYNKDGGVIPGAMVWVKDSLTIFGDVTDTAGYYSLSVNAGSYRIEIGDFTGTFSRRETTMTITGDTTQDFYLSPLNSYIRGYVRDENQNPIPNVYIWVEQGGEAQTDSNGMYKIMLQPGSGRFGIESNGLLPRYMIPEEHQYSIGENDSIVDNPISNFTCYSTNSTITGLVKEEGNIPVHIYSVGGWVEQLRSSTFALTDASGNFVLPVRDSSVALTYGVWIVDWDDEHPIPSGMYPDTSYWNILPGAGINFNIISAETSAEDKFTGNDIPPSPIWEYFNFNNPWDSLGTVILANNRLMIRCDSEIDVSGVGVVTRKPYSLNNLEYQIDIDHSEMIEDMIKIVLSDKKVSWNDPNGLENSLQLFREKDGLGYRWRFVKSENNNFSTFWTSSSGEGNKIVFRFDDPDTLTLKIDDNIVYKNSWGRHISMAYFYLIQINSEPNTPTATYFDNFFVGVPMVTDVRDMGGLIPAAFKLEQNYPNPFNPATDIRYQISDISYVILKVYDILGREAITLVDEAKQPGNYKVTWNASALGGLPSGVYYYRIIVTDVNTGAVVAKSIRKAVLVK